MSVFVFLLLQQDDVESEPTSVLAESSAGRSADRPEWVDATWIAAQTGLQESTIKKGKAGFKDLKPIQRKPLRWVRTDVERFLRARAEKLHESSRPKPRQGLIRRKARVTGC